jgi:hypothetical protein
MSYLLYCIFRGPLPADLETPTGVGGQRVFTVNHEGLGAVLSKLAEPDSPPDTSEVLVYETIVESFYRHLTVIPMRYGCRVESEWEAVGLLRKNHDAYGALLYELEGLGEMGVHILLDTSGDGMESNARPVSARSLALDSDTGAAYLAAKRMRYQALERAGLQQRQLVVELCDSLHGSFVRHKVELPPSSRDRLVSLYFLVPRDSVESFRQAARDLPASQSVKLLFSGPWPPYNFVDSLQL